MIYDCNYYITYLPLLLLYPSVDSQPAIGGSLLSILAVVVAVDHVRTFSKGSIHKEPPTIPFSPLLYTQRCPQNR